MNQEEELSEGEGTLPALVVTSLRRPGLKPATFRIEAGACVVLSGPSGAGKSLLLRAIADLDPCEGEVRLGSVSRRDVAAPAWRRQVMYVPAESGWWAQEVGAHFADRDAGAHLLEDVGLPDSALEWPVARLSTGERQRLALVRALALDPKVLLLDEPTSGVDPETTTRIESLLRRTLDRGTAILMVTHDRDQASRLADRQMTISQGRLSADPDKAGSARP